MSPVKALCLDLDETLFDGSGQAEAIHQVCALLSPQLDGYSTQQVFDANSQAWSEYWPAVEDRWCLGLLSDDDIGLEGWRRTLRACGRDDEKLVQQAREAHMEAARTTMRLFEDARQFLATQQSGFPLALITNGSSELQRKKLAALGLHDRFNALIISAEVGCTKPDPSIFALALDALGLRRDEAWHVGDSLRLDVAGARAAGLKGIWLNRNGRIRSETDAIPDYEIGSFNDVLPLIRAQ